MLDKQWHAECVRCHTCGDLLDHKCFFRDGNIYCREDFYRYSTPLETFHKTVQRVVELLFCFLAANCVDKFCIFAVLCILGQKVSAKNAIFRKSEI